MSEVEIGALLTRWQEETGHYANPRTIRRHPAYGRLVAAGLDVVPVVLAGLAAGNAWIHLSHLLGVVTGRTPDYRPERVGDTTVMAWDVRALARAWLDWGRANGYAVACGPEKIDSEE